jgi:hypothetical protein
MLSLDTLVVAVLALRDQRVRHTTYGPLFWLRSTPAVDSILDNDAINKAILDCKQAKEGEQLRGKDNEASGFNDPSKNISQKSCFFFNTRKLGIKNIHLQHRCLHCVHL